YGAGFGGKDTATLTDRSGMNRFFRSALFPLIVIVLLVYLASQALLGETPKQKLTYSELQPQVGSQGNSGTPEIKEIVINPKNQEMTVEYQPTDGGDKGTKTKVAYPSPESLVTFERDMRTHNVEYDSKSTGGSPWWSLLTSL